MQQLASDERDQYPLAKTTLLHEVYVDDILTGASSEERAQELRAQLQRLLMAGGFELRKWASNCPALLQDLPADHCRPTASEDPLCLDRDPILKILGLGWNLASDNFFYAVRLSETALTKRTILSQMARIFDPLGWLTPVTFRAKIFFRDLCRLQVGWDQRLPPELVEPWHAFQQQIPELGRIRIPRMLPDPAPPAQHYLVGFCDASESGYAAVVYLRTSSRQGPAEVQLLMAKSKVAPNKTQSLPRLELRGAHLLAKLMHAVRTRMLVCLEAPVVAFCESSATKAVHFDIASELSTSSFLAAFHRFIARRGLPSKMFSDNGTNFVGAHNELRELGRLLNNPQHQQAVSRAATAAGIDWHFIPPASPHFGGLWEAAIKSAKHHLTRVLGNQRLTYEELLTVVTQVEAILNSRPLCAVSSDPADPEPLTPGHFLAFRPLTALPEKDLHAVNPNRLSRWKLVNRIQQDLWKRWRNEYLHTLQQRSKWFLPASDIKPGTIVIINQDNLPPLQWPLGRIVALHPGRDSINRVADVKTRSGIIRRPLVKLCPLPTQ
ncbi:uncharacterized protein [Rhodnius prolixus]|uniref:uncharacterized protein n=1 Tax=Rhodnius prolixus TaxID=13249 RepID=UPI003D18CD46